MSMKKVKQKIEQKRTRIKDLSLGEILEEHLKEVLHIFAWIENYRDLNDFERNITQLDRAIRAVESFLSPNLDKNYWKAITKIESMEPKEKFEEKYSDALKYANSYKRRDRKQITGLRKKHRLDSEVLKLDLKLREIMKWIDKNEYGFQDISGTILERK